MGRCYSQDITASCVSVWWPWWTPSKTQRKGNEMNNDENWENEIDWSKLDEWNAMRSAV